jgi:tetratricopeptide (TPR) repeat protein
MLALLEEAQSLAAPSRGFYGLRSRCFQMLGEGQAAEEERKRAANPELGATALDHFLQGEHYRAEAAERVDAGAASLTFRPDRDRLAQAVAEYQQALELDPRHYWSRLQLGRCYLSLGRKAEAVDTLGACVALRPDCPWGYSTRGLALALSRRFQDAENDLRQALHLRPNFRPARLNIGLARWLDGDDRGALAEFDAAVKDGVIEAAYYRGQFLQRTDTAAALRDFDLVARENSGFRPVYLLRARAHLGLGQADECRKDLDAFLVHDKAYDPDAPAAYERRGRLLYLLLTHLPQDRQAKRAPLVCDELQQAAKGGVRSVALFTDLGLVLERMGQWEKAIQAYSEGLKQADNAALRIQRGWAYVQERRQEQAEADFARAVLLDPTNAEAHTGFGYLLAGGQKYAAAQREAAEALLRGPGDYLVLHNVACIYALLARGDKEWAAQYRDMTITLLGRAVELWRQGGAGPPDEIQLINNEPAFDDSLKQRFRKVLEGK